MKEPKEIVIPVPVLRLKGRSDSAESAKAMARGSFKVDPDLFDWTRVLVPEMIGVAAPPGYGPKQVKERDAAVWVGKPKARPN